MPFPTCHSRVCVDKEKTLNRCAHLNVHVDDDLVFPTLTFTFDAPGNRTLKNANTVRTTFNYDVANQLNYSLATAGRTTFLFDSAGNQRIEQPPTGSRTTTIWNYENQPTQYQLPDTSRVTLLYNADNRRVLKVVGSDTSKFIWDPVADAYQSELDAGNATQVVYTSQATQFGQLISQRRSSTSRWYHPDSLGSTRALSDSSQATTDTYLYDAWGNPLSSTGTTVNPFRWVGNVGYYFDQESGLYYIRARVYQPSIARWISADPLFYELARSGMFSLSSKDPRGYVAGECLYQFCNSRMLKMIDPMGTAVASAVKGACSIHIYNYPQYTGPGGGKIVPLPVGHLGALIEWERPPHTYIDGTKTNEMEETTTKPSNRPAKPIYTFPNLPTEVCNCFANSVAEWNKTPPDQRVRDDIFRNSNWVLKCALKRCGLTAPLGEPGYRGNSSKCLVWKQEYRLPIASGGPAVSCTLVSYCAKFQECPDGFDENVLAVKSN